MSNFEDHFESLRKKLKDNFPELTKQYDLSVGHSGGGCFHVEVIIGKKYILINPVSNNDIDDIIYDIPENINQNCMFGIYNDNEDSEEQKIITKPFQEGLEHLTKEYK
jgi:hypothetical protein